MAVPLGGNVQVAVVLFYVAAALAIAGAIVVVTVRNVVIAALGLVGSLVMVGAIFLVLHADFLALAQILIYATAVAILLLFGLMLTRAGAGADRARDMAQRPLALLAAAAFAGVMIWVAFATEWFDPGEDPPLLEPITGEELGQALFVQWAVPFEIASLVLLVAVIGAVVIARREPRPK